MSIEISLSRKLKQVLHRFFGLFRRPSVVISLQSSFMTFSFRIGFLRFNNSAISCNLLDSVAFCGLKFPDDKTSYLSFEFNRPTGPRRKPKVKVFRSVL